MITLRRAGDRGHFDHGWLDTRHTFSFADYYDVAQMGFRSLRVINEDRVQPSRGFGTHPHRDMEILTWVLEGALEHRDSLGNGSVIRPGDLQRMSAGTGVTHKESNPSPAELVHFLQIWIRPMHLGLSPSYEQKSFGNDELRGRLCLAASQDGQRGSLSVHQDAALYITRLGAREAVELDLARGRAAWVHVARGQAVLNGTDLATGDAVAVEKEPRLTLSAVESCEALVFDLG
jgi:redox-sensitive bicupin YhaK (pirin superfamily)